MDSIIEESRRLQEQYASLADDELEAVANDAFDLTDVAQQTLRAEIANRGLKIQLRTAPPSESEEVSGEIDPSSVDLALANRVWHRDEARRVMGILRDAGIPAYLGPNDVEDVDSFLSPYDGGVDVKVREIDHQRALHALSQRLPPPDEGAPVDYAARCPKCHSTEIVFGSLDKQAATESFATSKFNWSCDECGYQWKDDGVEEEA